MAATRHQSSLIESQPWAIRLSCTDAPSAAGALRLRPGLRGALDTSGIQEFWVRGESMDGSLDRALRQLAPAARYHIAPTGAGEELIPHGHLLPTAQLPGDLRWLPLQELFPVEFPPSALLGSKPPPVAITIVRCDQESPAAMLRTSLALWSTYAESAPSTRLRRLHFAATLDEVIVLGNPLPPIPGTRLSMSDRIAVPCGFAWSPAVDAVTLRRVLGLREHDIALFSENGSWQLISGDALVAARRSAIRCTAAMQRAAR